MTFGWEPRRTNHQVFIVCCPRCRTFESIDVWLPGDGVYRIEETSRYHEDKKSGDIVHICGKVCTFTGRRFVKQYAKMSRRVL